MTRLIVSRRLDTISAASTAEDSLPKPVNQVLLKTRIGARFEKKPLRDQQKAMVRRFTTMAKNTSR